jgi:Phage protein (N4 Gp49/phage Sf6 gene 66) family
MTLANKGNTMNDNIENEIQAKGLIAPRVTPDDINANIVSEHYFTAMDGAEAGYLNIMEHGSDPLPKSLNLLTFCVLVLRNGFTVAGESACASPENFDAEVGRKIARQNAVQKIWPLMGYELKCRLADSWAELQKPVEQTPAP